MTILSILLKRVAVIFLPWWIVFVSGCMDLASQTPSENKRGESYKPGQVYTMRGLGGIFSTGMNRLENTLDNYHNIRTSSTIWYKKDKLSQYIIERRRNKTLRGPIVLIGHSLGANEQIKVAQNLYEAHVPVDLLITVDAVAPMKIPPNVRYALNLYKPSFLPLFSGLKIEAQDAEFTYINNLDVSKIKNLYVNHFTIDKKPEIQKIMLEKVLAVINKNTKTV